MPDFLNGWKQFLNENKQLDEVTEEELSDIDEALHDLKPEDLPFNNLFGDNMRLAMPLRQKDENLEKLKRLLADNGYIPDFTTGLATYYEITFPPKYEDKRPTKMILTLKQTQDPKLVNDDRARKKQIKIGKLLQKGSRLFDVVKKASEEYESISPTDYSKEDWSKYAQKTMELEDNVDEKYKKLTNVFSAALPVVAADKNTYSELSEWWNKKSAFYREHPEEAEKGTASSDYSIIYSRHPIDVLRMSDFDNIYSCHSPRSGKGDASYYKCAVAEAHGHGAIAYIVKNKDLDSLIEMFFPDDQEKSYQELLDMYESEEEELFLDNERNIDGLEPVTRVRIRKYANPALEVVLAVPEERVYGTPFPKFVEQVTDWTKEKQKDIIKKVEDSKNSDDPSESTFDKEGNAIDLNQWERFGGSYQDTYDPEMFHNFFGYKTIGKAHWDNTTEDNLSLNSSVVERWTEEVNEIARRWNQNYQAIEVGVSVDEMDGEAFINWSANFNIGLDEDEFVKSAYNDETNAAITNLPHELIEYGFHWFQNYVSYTTANRNSGNWAELARYAVDKNGLNVIIEIPIDSQVVSEEGVWDPDSFDEVCRKLDEIDNKADAVLEITKRSLKREGILQGAALIQLAQALESETWYEWSYEVDDDWDPSSVEVETNIYVNFNDLIKKIPITFDYQPDKSSEVFIMFAGDPLALASRRDDGEGNFIDFEVRSPEFDHERMNGFKNMDAIKEYAQWNVAKMILRPKGQMSRIPKGYESTTDYRGAVKQLMRQAAGGEENKFHYPYASMWVNGPDSDDEYKMMFGMHLSDSDPDKVVNNAHKIMTETDDEDLLKELFHTAFAQVAKIPGATIKETKKYFRKFNLF